MKKLLLLVNPYSGRGISKVALGDIVSQFAANNYLVTVCLTKERRVSDLVRENAAGHDLLVCVGGDGTLSDVVTGLMDVENPPPIGYIPRGTANDMATTLALSRDLNTAVDTILNGNAVELDVGAYNDKYFTYVTAFGVFTGASYSTPQSAKRALGNLAYIFSGIADMAASKPRKTRVEFDGGFIEDEFIFGGVTNTTSVAGLVRLRSANVDLGDGKFEVILVRNPVKRQDFMDILTSLASNAFPSSTLLPEAIYSDNVRLIHTSRVKFTFDEPVAFTRDGENGGMHQELIIENRARAVKIIIPAKESEDAI